MYTRDKAQKEANLIDINWDIPGFKSSIIKTYSRKTPYVLVSATKQGVGEGHLPSKSGINYVIVVHEGGG